MEVKRPDDAKNQLGRKVPLLTLGVIDSEVVVGDDRDLADEQFSSRQRETQHLIAGTMSLEYPSESIGRVEQSGRLDRLSGLGPDTGAKGDVSHLTRPGDRCIVLTVCDDRTSKRMTTELDGDTCTPVGEIRHVFGHGRPPLSEQFSELLVFRSLFTNLLTQLLAQLRGEISDWVLVVCHSFSRSRHLVGTGG